MKALIISDKQEIIDFSGKFLTENGYDIIVYRWLLKAIDNIEEIQPDLIILSAAEYPRHWKTLASFVKSGIGGNNVQIYLYDPDSLSDEEKNKAVELGIKDYINSLNTKIFEKIISANKTQNTVNQDKNQNFTRCNTENVVLQDVNIDNAHQEKLIQQDGDITENFALQDDKIDDVKPEITIDENVSNPEEQSDCCKIIFTNPFTKKFILGTAVFEESDEIFTCEINDYADLQPEMIIKYVSIYDQNNQISVFSAKVIEIEKEESDSPKEKSLKLKTLEFYEKNR